MFECTRRRVRATWLSRGTDVEVVGQVLAAVDEPSADERFVEEVQANDPDSEVFLDGPGMVAYLTTFQGTSPEEPVWYATRNVRSTSGVGGRP